MEIIKIGIVGCGNISDVYCENFKERFNQWIELTSVADIVPERAESKAEKYGLKKVCSLDEMLSNSEIKIIVNLTPPSQHYKVSKRILQSGFNVYSEKPICVELAESKDLIDTAAKNNLLIGTAPDTFYGSGIQTTKKLIDDGWIGKPVGGIAGMLYAGPESWHPDPEFYYKRGGDTMSDMGPYYLTAFINLFGPVEYVLGLTCQSTPTRTITSAPKRNKVITVEVPTHIAALLKFKNGVIINITTSVDVIGSKIPHIEIYGTSGSILVPDPNYFSGNVQICKNTDKEWKTVPNVNGYSDNLRGIGVVDMARSLLTGKEHRANHKVAHHVLEVIHGVHIASESRKAYYLESTCEQPREFYNGEF